MIVKEGWAEKNVVEVPIVQKLIFKVSFTRKPFHFDLHLSLYLHVLTSNSVACTSRPGYLRLRLSFHLV
jgi:hypothetical protein